MTEISEQVLALEKRFSLHMSHEYPQIDPTTRFYLSYELALLAIVDVPYNEESHE